MRCEQCGHEDLRVIDSRHGENHEWVRRRRACQSCGHRFTTYEASISSWESELECHAKWGVSRSVYNALRAMADDFKETPMGQYQVQRQHARRRGISWQLSFDQWWKIWVESGKYEQRGRGWREYCMARFGDSGPYAMGNVKICTVAENNAEYWHSTRPSQKEQESEADMG